MFALVIVDCTTQNEVEKNKVPMSDTTDFYDSAHHWYDINDEEKIIKPDSDQKRYASSDIINVADNILSFQKSNGGWSKNYDMQAILNEEQEAAVLKTKNLLNTTFDNGATHSQLTYLAKAYLITQLDKYKNAFVLGIEYRLSAQYKNGGWPQFYPDTSGYRKYITFNDGAMVGIMNLLRIVVDNQDDFSFIDNKLYDNIKSAYQKGIECILNCQIEVNEVRTVWCQQHDNIDFHPQSARSFEPAAICNGESSAIVKFLMSVENPDERVILAIKNAVKWFEDSKIDGIRIKTIHAPKADFMYHSTEYDKVIVQDSDSPPIWTRFYELETQKPMFCNRNGKIVYSLSEVDRERRTGYAWYGYDPQEILDLYPAWKDK